MFTCALLISFSWFFVFHSSFNRKPISDTDWVSWRLNTVVLGVVLLILELVMFPFCFNDSRIWATWTLIKVYIKPDDLVLQDDLRMIQTSLCDSVESRTSDGLNKKHDINVSNDLISDQDITQNFKYFVFSLCQWINKIQTFVLVTMIMFSSIIWEWFKE